MIYNQLDWCPWLSTVSYIERVRVITVNFKHRFEIPDVPRITWVTPSPHLAAQDLSDVLEVKTENDKTLVRVDWYHNGTLVAKDTEGFTFPGKVDLLVFLLKLFFDWKF